MTPDQFISVSGNTFHHGDCLDVMRAIPDGSIDLIVTDPPYGMDYRSNRRTKSDKFARIAGDRVGTVELISSFLDEAFRVLKENTAIYLFASWHRIDEIKPLFEARFTAKNLLVWNKNVHGTGDLKGSFAPKHELILFGHKGRSLNRGKRIPDVIDCAKVPPNALIHPTEKPVDLLAKLIANSSDQGDIVLDAFAGAGSTCLAALDLQRKYIAMESDADHHATAKARIQTKMDENEQGLIDR